MNHATNVTVRVYSQGIQFYCALESKLIGLLNSRTGSDDADEAFGFLRALF